MSIIRIPLLYSGHNGEKRLYTLFDSGANLSCIHPDHVKNLVTPELLNTPNKLATAAMSRRDILLVPQTGTTVDCVPSGRFVLFSESS